MTYELAKQLKDAGFPQAKKLGGQFLGESMEVLVYSPPLSELIEACGKKLGSLYRSATGDWMAHTDMAWHKDFGLREKSMFERGDTPEEAVARLWLALNKK